MLNSAPFKVGDKVTCFYLCNPYDGEIVEISPEDKTALVCISRPNLPNINVRKWFSQLTDGPNE
jgi:hypothetical protein